MTDLALLKELLALLDSSSATTIEVRRWFTTYKVSNEGGQAVPRRLNPSPAGGQAVGSPAPPLTARAPAGGGGAGGTALESPPGAVTLLEIKSPMVGTFYRAPEPGAEPYVRVGSRVSLGQTLCLIEAMKIMNEIESEVTGVIHELLVEDAQPVEFGQVLFRVEPHV